MYILSDTSRQGWRQHNILNGDFPFVNSFNQLRGAGVF